MCEILDFYCLDLPDAEGLQHEKLMNGISYWGDGGVSTLQHGVQDMYESVRDNALVVSKSLDKLSRYISDLEKLLRDTYPEALRDR
ncbi:hypothetical protein [Serratia ureilytica]|uniref:hypothetical protein n=1 Tax=Serratia ureilytica TaxID=300181 RepID=UPI0034C65B91